MRASGLQPAHRGYNYQDLVTAYLLVLSLLGERPSVTVDRKASDDDRFDDVSVESQRYSIRRQIKHSSAGSRALSADDFIAPNSSLRLDRLVASFAADAPPADQYRLCATWDSVDAELLDFLRPVHEAPTVLGSAPLMFKFNLERILIAADDNPFPEILGDSTSSAEEVSNFCERFTIELRMPRASMDLDRPAALETALIGLLADRIGIGDYPNQGRSPADVAAVAIRTASVARGEQRTLTASEVEAALSIRKDFGYVPQQFPIRWDRFCDRAETIGKIRSLVISSRMVIVEGDPGIGKSWLLTKLCQDLERTDYLVARHYCYLEPGDPFAGRRITVDVLFGNLLEELTRKAPHLLQGIPRRYAATQESLEKAIEVAASSGTNVCLVVDGLDHIMRVRADSPSLSIEDTSIVEHISALHLPEQCSLVLGTQPGPHIGALRGQAKAANTTIRIPAWTGAELRELLAGIGLAAELENHGLKAEPIVDAFIASTDGSPLYAHSLALDLTHRLAIGEVTDPLRWLSAIPPIHGQIANYYDYLFSSLEELPREFAKVFGAIDFSISAADIRAMFPAPFSTKVEDSLARLSPVLVSTSAQGGYRVYHESFRRFIAEWISSRGESIADILAPVIGWLAARGFYSDALAFRFLLPTLFRAARYGDVSQFVARDFVSTSLAHGHPREPISRNLILAAHCAAKRLSWPDLIRCVELHRSVYESFEMKLGDASTYWDTYTSLFGPESLLDRLLFDGRPMCTHEVGLRLCRRLESLDVSAPWREYLELFDRDEEPNEEIALADRYEPTIDGLSHSQRELLNVVTGRIRIAGLEKTLRRVWRAMLTDSWDANIRLRVAVLRLLSLNLDRKQIGRSVLRPWVRRLTDEWQAALYLVAAESLSGDDDANTRVQLADWAAEKFDDPRLLLACIEAGASQSVVARWLEPVDLSALSLGGHSPDRDPVENWYLAVRLTARCNPDEIDALLLGLSGDGWYVCWIKYVVLISAAEMDLARGGDRTLLIDAFSTLVEDTEPFAGTPRACDLYSIRGVIAESIVWGLSLLQTDAEWTAALSFVRRAMEGTTTSLQRSVSGPIQPDILLPQLLRYSSLPEAQDALKEFFASAMRDRDEHGTYLESHAELGMLYAQILSVCGDQDGARRIWSDVCVMLCGYGHRKDTTIYELMEADINIVFPERGQAIDALVALQPLVESMWKHTDGRSTRGAPNAWFRQLISVDPALATAMVAEAMHGADGDLGWTVEEALEDLGKFAAAVVDPRLVSSIFATLTFDPEHSREALARLDAEEIVIRRLAAIDSTAAQERLVRLAAQIDGDGRQRGGDLANRVNGVAAASGLTTPLPTHRADGDDREPSRNADLSGENVVIRLEPWFDRETTRVAVVTGIRRAFERDGRLRNGWDGFAEALGYRLVSLEQSGEVFDALTAAVRFLADRLRATFVDVPLLEQLGEGFERQGMRRLAAYTYAVAYITSRGHGGWASSGDETRAIWLRRAVDLDRPLALQVVAEEVVKLLDTSEATFFVTGGLIARLAEISTDDAAASWWEAFGVVKRRLPLVGSKTRWLVPLAQNRRAPWSIDEALIAVVLARVDHPLLAVKVAALAEIDALVRTEDERLIGPLRWFLTRNATTTSLLAVLGVLVESGHATALADGLEPELGLLAEGAVWGVGYLARTLLQQRLGSGASVTFESATVRYLPEGKLGPIADAFEDPRLDGLRELFPDLSQAIQWRAVRILGDSDTQATIRKDRYKLAFGREKELSAARVLTWDAEIWEQALHDVLPEMVEGLQAEQRWDETHERQLAAIVIPDFRLYVACERARVPRPNYPLPSSLDEGQSRKFVSRVSDDDPRYARWYRLGYFERQNPRRPSVGSGIEPGRIILAGVIAEPHFAHFPSGQVAFGAAEPNDWFANAVETNQRFAGCAASDSQLDSCFGRQTILIPGLDLRGVIGLTIGAEGTKLSLDGGGSTGIVFRTWRVRNNRSWDAPRNWLVGCDLLVRPDIFFRMELMSEDLLEIEVAISLD